METPNYLPTLLLNDDSKSYLNESARWGRILAYIGFFFSGIIMLTGLVTIFTGSNLTSMLGAEAFTLGLVAGIINLSIGAAYLYPSLKLLNFSKELPQALESGDVNLLAMALGNLKSVFKFWGYLTILIIALYLLVIVASLVASIFLKNNPGF